jgi:acetyl esterase/lipase
MAIQKTTARRAARVALVCGMTALASACGKSGETGSAADTTTAGGAVAPTSDSGASAANGTTPAAPDAQMKAVLDQHAALGPKPLETLTPAEARKQPTPADAVKAELEKAGKPTAPDPAVASVDRTISTPNGNLPARIYTPATGTGPFPVVVYYHGGGWVIADKDVYDGGARALSKMANAVVVSVDYRQAPEHKFPAAHDDAIAAYRWALGNAASIKGDPKRVALAGESAGGNLAVATAMAARDQKLQMPSSVVAVYPIAGSDTTTPSYVQNATAKPLGRSAMSWFFGHYLRSDADRQDPRINLVAADLKGLPATTIINAEIDPLRSEGETLAERLRAAGVATEQRTFPGVAHEFFGMGAVVDKATDAQTMAGNALKKGFGG